MGSLLGPRHFLKTTRARFQESSRPFLLITRSLGKNPQPSVMPEPAFIFFEDVSVGEERWSPALVVDGAEMLEYDRCNDPWPFLVDEAAAKESLFGGNFGAVDIRSR